VPTLSVEKKINSGELKVLKSVLVDTQPLPLPPDSSDDAIAELHEMLLELRNFLANLLEGTPTYPIAHKGYLAGVVKSLQSHLKRLSVQARTASQNDPAQEIDLLKDFTESLSITTKELTEAKQELEQAREILKLNMDTDTLTGLYNFSFLMKTLEYEIERSRRYNAPLSIALLDVDNLLKINDMYGHRVGDAVLAQIAVQIREILRPSDTAGRYGGGEFLLILPSTDYDGAWTLAERIRSLIATTSFAEARPSVTISGGVASWENHKVLDLIHEANRNLYVSKHNKKSKG